MNGDRPARDGSVTKCQHLLISHPGRQPNRVPPCTASLTALALAAAMGLSSVATALAEKVNVSFIVASDMDTMGREDRGGQARLAAIVKAERANGGNLIYVFPGDLLSPSILAGFDQGKHMIGLLNMNPPDILVPGNHEYDSAPKTCIDGRLTIE